MGYQEDFISGDRNEGAYVCRIRIAAPVIQMLAGGPGGYAAPLAGTHPEAFQGNSLVVPLLAATATAVEEFVMPTFEQIAAAGLKALWESIVAGAAAATPPVALTAALILASSTPAGGAGIPQPHVLPIDPDRARLAYLEAEQEQRALTDDEQDEVVILLASVRKMFVGGRAGLPGYYAQHAAELTLLKALKPSGKYHSINTFTSDNRFGAGGRYTLKTIAKGHVNIQEDFAHIKAGQATYDRQTQTFTITGRVYGFHADQITSGGTSSIYPIRGNPGDFVNVTQAEFRILRKMIDSQGLNGDALLALDGMLRANNEGVDTNAGTKLMDLYNSRRP